MAKKTKKIVVCEITHWCGHVLGAFISIDDHGEIEVLCPKCKKLVRISISYAMELVEDFNLPEDDRSYNHDLELPTCNNCRYKAVQTEVK